MPAGFLPGLFRGAPRFDATHGAGILISAGLLVPEKAAVVIQAFRPLFSQLRGILRLVKGIGVDRSSAVPGILLPVPELFPRFVRLNRRRRILPEIRAASGGAVGLLLMSVQNPLPPSRGAYRRPESDSGLFIILRQTF